MKRRRYALTIDAQRDLAEIYLYFADAGDPATGQRLVGSLESKIRSLPDQEVPVWPEIGYLLA